MKFRARHYATGQVVDVAVSAGTVCLLDPSTSESGSESWLAPGFVDLQINGYGGHEFNEAGITAELVRTIVLAQDQFGVTSFCPTTTTQSLDRLQAAMKAMATACEQYPEVASRIIGIHLEGPFISAEDGPRGAHPKEHCRPPDWEAFQRLQDASGGRIRIVTMSAEYEDAPGFIRRAVATGVVIAIGHTNANTDQISRAVEAGASFSTHLGNAAHPRIRRHPNYIWDQLADDRLAATLIVDGQHLPPSVVKSFVRVKSPERCALISDITGMAGMPPGNYSGTPLGNIEVLDDGRLVVAGQRDLLAGASLPIGVGVCNVMQFAQVDLRTAVEMATRHAARLVNYPMNPLQPGVPADLVLFDLTNRSKKSEQLVIRATIKAGELSFGSLPTSI